MEGIPDRRVSSRADPRQPGVHRRAACFSRAASTRATPAFTGERSLSVVSYGVSVAQAWRKVWLGAGLSVNRFVLGFEFDRAPARWICAASMARRFRARACFISASTGDASSIGGVIGLLIPVSTRTKIGASYRRVSSFEFSSFSGGLAGTQQRTTADFNVPDVLAVGLSTRLKDAFRSRPNTNASSIRNCGRTTSRSWSIRARPATALTVSPSTTPMRCTSARSTCCRSAPVPRFAPARGSIPTTRCTIRRRPANDLLDERVAIEPLLRTRSCGTTRSART